MQPVENPNIVVEHLTQKYKNIEINIILKTTLLESLLPNIDSRYNKVDWVWDIYLLIPNKIYKKISKNIKKEERIYLNHIDVNLWRINIKPQKEYYDRNGIFQEVKDIIDKLYEK